MVQVVNRTLDLRGLYCPEPLFKTKIAIDSMTVGSLLEVIADDPTAEDDMSSWARRTGQELISITRIGRELHFLIRKAK